MLQSGPSLDGGPLHSFAAGTAADKYRRSRYGLWSGRGTRDGPICWLHRGELGRRTQPGSTVAAVLPLSASLPKTF